MNFKKNLGLTAIASLIGIASIAQEKAVNDPIHTKKMEWFDEAKLGIFIHWGIYSVNGISESWAFFNNYINHENYMQQLGGFTAANYKPAEWVKLIQEAGAKYAVITAKHHDGVSLWATEAPGATSTLQHSAAKQDVLSPFVQELKKSGLKTGIYYSLPDWSHPNYDVKTRTQKRYTLADQPESWNKYLDYYQQQLTEISKSYSPDLIWFDGDWEHSSAEWQAPQTLSLLRKYNPNIIINSRLNDHGDYETPEQGVPVVKPASRYWELCYTMNDSWGYQPFDKHYKTPNMIVRTLVDCIAMGGNLLLDIGPKADGTIPAEQLAILQELKRWTGKHSEAIYGTRAGLDRYFGLHKTALSKDGKTLFVYLDKLTESLRLTNLSVAPKNVRLVGAEAKLNFTYDKFVLEVGLPTAKFDSAVTVVALDFEEKPSVVSSSKGFTRTLNEIVAMEDTQKTIQDLVYKASEGTDLWAGKLSEDGRFLDSKLQIASPKVKAWVSKHAEALHAVEEGMPAGHFEGYSALSKDKQTLFLFVEGKPTGPIALKGLKNSIARIRIVGEGSMISHQIFNKLYWSAVPGIVYIDVPEERLDPTITVIAVLLDKPIELYREQVGAIESNL